jgi:hypothetical protein
MPNLRFVVGHVSLDPSQPLLLLFFLGKVVDWLHVEFRSSQGGELRARFICGV